MDPVVCCAAAMALARTVAAMKRVNIFSPLGVPIVLQSGGEVNRMRGSGEATGRAELRCRFGERVDLASSERIQSAPRELEPAVRRPAARAATPFG